MTKFLDRLLGLTTSPADASAACAHDSWTECKSNYLGINSWNKCYRTATLQNNCTVTYSPWSCRCYNTPC